MSPQRSRTRENLSKENRKREVWKETFGGFAQTRVNALKAGNITSCYKRHRVASG